jgi:hypothetical protein
LNSPNSAPVFPMSIPQISIYIKRTPAYSVHGISHASMSAAQDPLKRMGMSDLPSFVFPAPSCSSSDDLTSLAFRLSNQSYKHRQHNITCILSRCPDSICTCLPSPQFDFFSSTTFPAPVPWLRPYWILHCIQHQNSRTTASPELAEPRVASRPRGPEKILRLPRHCGELTRQCGELTRRWLCHCCGRDEEPCSL